MSHTTFYVKNLYFGGQTLQSDSLAVLEGVNIDSSLYNTTGAC